MNAKANHRKNEDTKLAGCKKRPLQHVPSCIALYKDSSFYVGGNNGSSLLSDCLESIGWNRSACKSDDTVTLKWCEGRAGINYASFREGEQLVNHIPNCDLLTNKLGLLLSLRQLARRSPAASVAHRCLPETFRLDDPAERDEFQRTFRDGDIWICKPLGKNQGRGIYLLRELSTLEQNLRLHEKENEQRKGNDETEKPFNFIVQRYLSNPLLLNRKKFDIRAYMLVASTTPYLLLYHHGHVRLSIYDYDTDSQNMVAHLTNQFVQKQDPLYEEIKNSTCWSFGELNKYFNDEIAPLRGLAPDWVYTNLVKQMQEIMLVTFTAVKAKLKRRLGYFDLYGLDFMVDDDMKVFLIECNINPSLSTSCDAQKECVPSLVRETLFLVIECFDKSRRGRHLLPLSSLRSFIVLQSDCPSAKKYPNFANSSATEVSSKSPTDANGSGANGKLKMHQLTRRTKAPPRSLNSGHQFAFLRQSTSPIPKRTSHRQSATVGGPQNNFFGNGTTQSAVTSSQRQNFNRSGNFNIQSHASAIHSGSVNNNWKRNGAQQNRLESWLEKSAKQPTQKIEKLKEDLEVSESQPAGSDAPKHIKTTRHQTISLKNLTNQASPTMTTTTMARLSKDDEKKEDIPASTVLRQPECGRKLKENTERIELEARKESWQKSEQRSSARVGRVRRFSSKHWASQHWAEKVYAPVARKKRAGQHGHRGQHGQRPMVDRKFEAAHSGKIGLGKSMADGANVVSGAVGASVVTGTGGASVVTEAGGASVATSAGGASMVTGSEGASVVTGARGASVVTGPGGASVATGPGGASVVTGPGGASVATGVESTLISAVA